MTASATSATSGAAGLDDYAYGMLVTVPAEEVINALTDETIIRRWWTVWTESARQGDEVKLFAGGAAPLVFTVEHAPGTSDVTWTVTACGVLPDWVGTKPRFSVRSNDDGSCNVSFRHAGLGPALECFEQCRAGWDHFMPSLHRYLDVGQGLPNEPRLTSV